MAIHKSHQAEQKEVANQEVVIKEKDELEEQILHDSQHQGLFKPNEASEIDQTVDEIQEKEKEEEEKQASKKKQGKQLMT